MGPIDSITRFLRRPVLGRLHRAQTGLSRMGRTGVNKEEGRFQVGPHEEQRLRVRTEPSGFTKLPRGRDREDRCQEKVLSFVSVEK